jgi:hypothetical protein
MACWPFLADNLFTVRLFKKVVTCSSRIVADCCFFKQVLNYKDENNDYHDKL